MTPPFIYEKDIVFRLQNKKKLLFVFATPCFVLIYIHFGSQFP